MAGVCAYFRDFFCFRSLRFRPMSEPTLLLAFSVPGVRKIILVTSSAHEWRAVQEFAGAGFNVLPGPVGVLSTREYGIFQFLPSAGALQRSHSAVYELIGEPMRRLLSASGLRENLSRR